MRNSRLPVPTEAQEQITLMNWAAMQSGKYPELKLLYHVPNGGSRNKAEAGRLRAEGVKAGVPDLCLPVPRGGYHGLYIELKRQRGGRASDNQVEWLDALSKQGYPVETTFAYYRLIELSATGTLDDPIPYPETAGIVVNVVSGLYYSYKGGVYLAKADMPDCVYPPDTTSLWQWEKVERR